MPTQNPGNLLRSDRWLLPAMLAPLHGVILIDNIWIYPLLVIHLALFVLWQPHGQRKVFYGTCIVLVAAVFWFNWLAIAFWLTSLFGLIGARSFAIRDRWAHVMHISAMAYLCAALLLWVAPNLFAAKNVLGYFATWYLLPALLLCPPILSLLMRAIFPVSNGHTSICHSINEADHLPKNENQIYFKGAQSVNFIYSLLLFMLLALITLGSLAFMTLAQISYHEALLRALVLTGTAWLLLVMLWSPSFGSNGIKLIFSRYLLNAGISFESWFANLAEAAQREPDPVSYLRSATRLLVDFPWLSGLSWQSPDGTGQLGQFSEHELHVIEGELRLTLYVRQSLNPAVLPHIHRLAQLVGYFYQAKQREQSLRNIARLQAVYETGSRLTHDLKNMLQSLLCITALAQRREPQAQQQLQQQLPMLAQRIESILNKLQRGESETPQLALAAWWDALQMRNRHRIIEWRAPDILPDKTIPATLFDCALDNLLENALRKRQFQPDIRITVTIFAESQNTGHSAWESEKNPLAINKLRLTVCDSGDPVPDAIAENLLRSVVVSENGLGIGVYQVARWAEHLGYRLTLSSNQTGQVCFELRG